MITAATIPPATVGGVPVAAWQKAKTDAAFALYQSRRIREPWTERAAAFALQARLVAITAMADAAEGGLR